MRAILLCAGFATRMYPFTKDFPKSLLPVAGKPVIDYLMKQIITLPKIRNVHIVTNAKFFEKFEKWQRTWLDVMRSKGIQFKLINNGVTSDNNRRGAVGDLLYAIQKISEPSKILVSAGDNIFRFRIEALWKRFLKSKHHCIIALAEIDKAKLKRSGVLILGKDGRVLKLYEKPENPLTGWLCPPLYFFQASVWSKLNEYIQVTNKPDELGYFIDALCQKEKVNAFKLRASRLDIGNIDSYRKADDYLKKEPLFT